MCETVPANRIQQFASIERAIQSDMFYEIGFDEEEIDSYRCFANELDTHISKLEQNTKYQDDIEKVLAGLGNAYRSFMLEAYVPDSATVTRCLINGMYYYKKNGFPVPVVKALLHLLKSSSMEKRKIILSNLHTRLDAIARYDPDKEKKDDLPF